MFGPSIRPPAVAGLFYEGDPQRLSLDLAGLLDAAPRTELKAKALVVPHAGYIYSGPVAASAYRLLQNQADSIRRVILLGPTHRMAVHGLAVPTVASFSTPLGVVPLDRAAMARISTLSQVVQSDGPHAMEHALEVQLPFLQAVLGDFQLVPLAVGDASAEEVAEVIEQLWGGEDTMILVSTDLSHYHTYNEARRIDRATVESILDLEGPLDHEQACGATPLNGLLRVARRKGLRPHLLDLRNSGDTAGDKDRVVGYAAIAFSPGDDHGH
ncbi:MAG TPA: AmmeMemoRadiSam system protein B [Thiobacillaceae bacterium]|nr:AmmeMemoRadiSam system protein B [Thiobacillaceae bacterium]